MTDEQLNELEATAKAATPGPWETKAGPDFSEILANSKNIALVGSQHKDAAYIAAVSPDVVLELIGELRRARMYMAERHAFRAAWKEEWVLQNMLSGWLESIAKGETPACMAECKTAHDFVSYAAWVDAKQRGLPCSETFGKSNGE